MGRTHDESMSVLHWVPVVLVVPLASVFMQWRAARERWRTTTAHEAGDGVYRSQVSTLVSAPRFPKRIATLSFLTSVWGVLTLLFAAAALLFVTVIHSPEASRVFIFIVSASGIVHGISAFVLASRMIRRSERAPRSIRWYTGLGITHHIAVVLVFALGGSERLQMLPFVLCACGVGIVLTAAVPWGTRGAFAPRASA